MSIDILVTVDQSGCIYCCSMYCNLQQNNTSIARSLYQVIMGSSSCSRLSARVSKCCHIGLQQVCCGVCAYYRTLWVLLLCYVATHHGDNNLKLLVMCIGWIMHHSMRKDPNKNYFVSQLEYSLNLQMSIYCLKVHLSSTDNYIVKKSLSVCSRLTLKK